MFGGLTPKLELPKITYRRFNNRRLLEPIGHIPPAEYELMYDQQIKSYKAA